MTVPISQPRMPPVSYSATASAWPGYCGGGDVGQQRARVEVHGVAADRPHDRHAGREQRVAEVRGGADPVAQVVVIARISRSPWAIASRSRPASPP